MRYEVHAPPPQKDLARRYTHCGSTYYGQVYRRFKDEPDVKLRPTDMLPPPRRADLDDETLQATFCLTLTPALTLALTLVLTLALTLALTPALTPTLTLALT